MKICANCGTQVPDDATFCNNCGSAMTGSESVAPSGDDAQNAATPVQPAQPQPMQPYPQQNFQGGYQQAPYGQNPYQQGYGYPVYDPKDHTAEYDAADIAENKIFAAMPYFFTCVVGLIAGIYVHDSAFVKFHIKNAAKLDIITAILCLFFVVPFVGWIFSGVCLLILFIVRIICMVQVLQGKAVDAPIVGSIGFLR